MEDRGKQQQQSGQQQGQSRQPQQSEAAVSGLGDSGASRSSGQQGAGQQGSGQDRPGQQQQFDRGTSQQGGGSGADSRFADQIREHMEVIDDSGRHCGTVDHVEGDRIKLARSDASDGKHHYVTLSQVAGIEAGKLRLRERGDNDFGMESGV